METTEKLDRQALFCVLAIKLEFATPGQVLEILRAARQESVTGSIGRRFVEAGILSEEQQALVACMLERAVETCQGSPSRTLQTLGGEQALRSCFGQLVQRDERGRLSIHETLSAGAGTAGDVTVEHPGRYTIAGEQGQGGQSRVYRAWDDHVGRNVAFKELLARGEDEGAARFLREARITGLLEHPSIIPVYEIGRRLDGQLYYTMRLVRGETLGKALQRCRTLQDRLDLLESFEALCQAVAYAHSRGVIHRDLKPDNVMIGPFRETIVLDWGLARHLRGEGGQDDGAEPGAAWGAARTLADSGVADTLVDSRGALPEETSSGTDTVTDGARTRHLASATGPVDEDILRTAAGAILGTPAYMSPEQALGIPEQVDHRSDIWGLGAILYETLTGRPPTQGATVLEILRKLMDDPGVPPVRSVRPDVPPALAAIAEKALDPDPSRRFQDAREMAREVHAWRHGDFIRSYRYSPWEIARQFIGRHLSIATLMIVAFYALLGLGLHSYLRVRDEASRAQIQRAAAQDLAGSLSTEFAQDVKGLTGAISLRCDLLGSVVAYLAQDGADGGAEAKVPLATASLQYGEVLRQLGRYDEADRSFERAVRIFEEQFRQKRDFASTHGLAWSCKNLAGVRQERGRLDEARSLYRRSQEILDSLVAADSDRAFLRADLAFVHVGLGYLALLGDRCDEADAEMRKALALVQECRRRDSTNVLWQTDEIAMLYNLSDVVRVRGKVGEADEILRKALGLGRRLAEQYPMNQGVQDKLLFALVGAAQSREAVALGLRLRRAEPERWWLAAELAEAALASGQYGLARAQADDSRRLAQQVPDQLLVSLLYGCLASDLLGDAGTARARLAEARALAPRVAVDPTWSYYLLVEHARGSDSPRAADVLQFLQGLEEARRAGSAYSQRLQALLEAYEKSIPSGGSR